VAVSFNQNMSKSYGCWDDRAYCRSAILSAFRINRYMQQTSTLNNKRNVWITYEVDNEKDKFDIILISTLFYQIKEMKDPHNCLKISRTYEKNITCVRI